jgi:hypothetical protein
MYNEVKHNEVKHNEVMDKALTDKALADKALADKQLVEQYIAQLTPSEKIVFAIAQKQLESSFCIEKSIGFLQYLKNLSTVKNLSS